MTKLTSRDPKGARQMEHGSEWVAGTDGAGGLTTISISISISIALSNELIVAVMLLGQVISAKVHEPASAKRPTKKPPQINTSTQAVISTQQQLNELLISKKQLK